MNDAIRVQIFEGRSEVDAATEQLVEPTHELELDAGTTHLWQDDPHYHSPPLGFAIHEEDMPATLYVYTNDSVRTPPVLETRVDEAEWDGPVERGLPFSPEHDWSPFGCEVWGRVLLYVEEGLTR